MPPALGKCRRRWADGEDRQGGEQQPRTQPAAR
jgi:hypothetical protein